MDNNSLDSSIKLAAAINPEFTYLLVNYKGEKLILSENRAKAVLGEDFEVIKKLSTNDLEGIKYEPPFDFAEFTKDEENRAFKVIFGDFVTGEDGTGIVHMAPAFGEDDLECRKKV